MSTQRLVTSQLRKGDLVHAYGLKVRLTEDLNRSTVGAYGPVYWAEGDVENLDDLKVSDPWLARYAGPRWSIQGNDNAVWSVEREEVQS